MNAEERIYAAGQEKLIAVQREQIKLLYERKELLEEKLEHEKKGK